MRKKKNIIFIVMGIIVVAAAAVLVVVLLLSTPHVASVDIERTDDSPMIAYQKLESVEGINQIYSLNMCPVGGLPQKVISRVYTMDVGANNKLIGYGFDNENSYISHDIYLMDSSGRSQLCARDVRYYGVIDDQLAISYVLDDQLDTLYIREYTPDGQLENEEEIDIGDKVFSDEINIESGIVAIRKDLRSDQEDESDDEDDKAYEFDWADLYIYSNGTMDKIAEKAFLSNKYQSISNNGSVLYLADSNEETQTGTLYLKEMQGEPKIITENSTYSFAISIDGNLIAAIVKDQNNADTLFYQYSGFDPNYIAGVDQFEISKDGSTLVYSTYADDGTSEALYCIKEDAEPVLLTDNISFLLEASDDGGTVAYIANYDMNTQTGDLYIAREGEPPEYIDDDIVVSGITAIFGASLVNLSDDGDLIAYLKNYDDNYLRGDLYVKQGDGQPQMVDDLVLSGFDFFE